MKETKTIGIIGGGLAGLTAGGLLARLGYDVKLFEANPKSGGCCSTTSINGYTFNDGALYVVLPGILDHVFGRLDLNREVLLPMRRITAAQTTYLPDETVITNGDRLELTVRRKEVINDTTRIMDELRRSVEKWEPILHLFSSDILLHPFSYTRLLRKGLRCLPKLRGTIASELDSLFTDESVKAAFSGTLLFSGLPPQKTPILSILGLFAMLNEGFFLPEGGMGKIPEALSSSLSQYGGEIHLNSKVKQIILRNGRVCGLEIDGKGEVSVDAVISTVSGMITTCKLLKREDVPAKMLHKAETAPLSHKSFLLQLGLRNQIEEHSHSVNYLPLMKEQFKIFQPDERDVSWPIFSVPTVTMPELAPPEGSIVEMFPPIRQDLPVEAWDEQRTGQVVETAVNALRQRYEVDIAVKRVLTPKDLQESMHLYKGAVYGLSPAAGPEKQFPYKTPIPGLYQAGQTTYPGFGVVFSAISGLFAADCLMKADKGNNIRRTWNS